VTAAAPYPPPPQTPEMAPIPRPSPTSSNLTRSYPGSKLLTPQHAPLWQMPIRSSEGGGGGPIPRCQPFALFFSLFGSHRTCIRETGVMWLPSSHLSGLASDAQYYYSYFLQGCCRGGGALLADFPFTAVTTPAFARKSGCCDTCESLR
jgi:hypothetical protein